MILSHDHYDHLDHGAILALQEKVDHFITPLGVGRASWPGDCEGEDPRTGLVAADPGGRCHPGSDPGPAFLRPWPRGRQPDPLGLLGHSRRGVNLFFSGDSGYFDGFKEIGRRYGPFDVTFLETGAYDKRWELVHMLPAQTAQAFHDLGEMALSGAQRHLRSGHAPLERPA